MSTHVPASILARLLTQAKQRGDDYSLLLNRFALERLLLRLSSSAHANRFLLKGALLFALWYDTPHRPTRDADLLGFGPDDEANLIATFREIAAMEVDDGIVFDVGFGDAVTPQPLTLAYPTLLPGFQAPTLRVYPVYTVVAEKYHAMVVLGQANSRVKDFYDLAVIARRTGLDGATLAAAIAATFDRRKTPLPTEAPLALTLAFGTDPTKQRQWQAFLNKNRITAASLSDTVALLSALLWPATVVAASASNATAKWHAETLQWA